MWTFVNGYLMAAIVDIGERDGFDCTTGQPEPALLLATAGIVGAGAFGLGASIAGLRRIVLAAIIVQIVFTVLWIAAGGFDAYDCALDI